MPVARENLPALPVLPVIIVNGVMQVVPVEYVNLRKKRKPSRKNSQRQNLANAGPLLKKVQDAPVPLVPRDIVGNMEDE